MKHLTDLNNLNEKEQVNKLTEHLTNIKTVEDLDYNTYNLLNQIIDYGKTYKKKLIKAILCILPFIALGGFVIALPFLIGATGEAFTYAIVMGGTVVSAASAGSTISVLYFSDKVLLKVYKQLKKAKVLDKLNSLTAEYEKSPKFETDKNEYEQALLKQQYEAKSIEADKRIAMAESQVSLLTKKLQQLKEKNNSNMQAEFSATSFENLNASITMKELEDLESLITENKVLESKIHSQPNP